MKVLHVFKDYFPPTRGGIELHIHDLVHSMDGVSFEVLTSSRTRAGQDEFDGGVRVLRMPEYARPTSTPVTPGWARQLRQTDADLIHFHMPNPFGELMLLASRTRVPVLAAYHADIVGRAAALPFYLPFQRRVLARAQRVVVGSPPMLANTRLAGQSHKLVVIPYGVDPQAWRERPAYTDELRECYGPKIILFLGRLAYYKGIDVLVDAIRAVEGVLLVVGSGPKESELREQARSLGVKDRVVFVGEIANEQRAAYYHAADVFALPATARGEAFGIAMLEAMATGTPVVSTELGTGTSWVNEHGRTGLVVPPGDPSALSGALRALLSDPGLARAMGDAAAERVAERFPKSAMVQSMKELYREMVSG